jgi:DNA invertase Pin-like site-specific DNA recombinase
MNSKITLKHRQKSACVYIRQSSKYQVLHHQESTERQYALREKAIALGWPPSKIRILDRDLGISGAQMTDREDFKVVVADVSMNQVGAVFALEASRLARSCADWHRLIELCGLTDTLLVDEDGIYNPADFNDRLLLGMKGTMSAAELHFLRARLQGGKRHKAEKGELRFPVPVGLCWDEQHRIVLDPDEQVRSAVALVFRVFRQGGSAYAVARYFADQGLEFPKRAYGGAWDGKLIWGRLSDRRVLSILKNPAYAGVYAFGRYRCVKEILEDGEIRSKLRLMPRAEWLVEIRDHHEGYVSFEQYLDNLDRLERNRTNADPLPGPAREGLAHLQGLLVCGRCGRRLTVRYKGNGGIYPVYECNGLRHDHLATTTCVAARCDLFDRTVSQRVLDVFQDEHLDLGLRALEELESRQGTIDQQWQLRIQRAQYEADLAQRRYEQVDPANRLVAASLEARWNEALEQLEETRQQSAEFQARTSPAVTPAKRQEIHTLSHDVPRLWNRSTTPPRDKKRILRLLLKDITVEKTAPKQLTLHVRWQGGACEDLHFEVPPSSADQRRYPAAIVERVRQLARENTDDQIAAELDQDGLRSPTGKRFTASIIRWIRYRYEIPAPELRSPEELTVAQVAEHFGVSHGVVYYWIERDILPARRLNRGSPYWITLDDAKQSQLQQWVRDSSRIATSQN